MRSSPVFGSPIRPFKARGIVKDVEPAVLATMFLGLALKWPERNHQVKRRKQEVRRVERVDWSTTLWFEHEKIPVPFVADRECLYLETFKHCAGPDSSENGESFMIVRKSVETADVPVAPGRVRGLSYVVMTFRRDPAGHGTEQTLAMDFDIKGRLPGRAVDGFLAQQAALFGKLTKFVGSRVRSVPMLSSLVFYPGLSSRLYTLSAAYWTMVNDSGVDMCGAGWTEHDRARKEATSRGSLASIASDARPTIVMHTVVLPTIVVASNEL
jgi:hypothetical protein